MSVIRWRQAWLIGAFAVIATLGSGIPGTAQQSDLPDAEEPSIRDIPLREWMDRVAGRTVYYSIDGAPFGREYYAPDGRSVVFQHVGGTCLEGEWFYSPDVRAYCYIWPGSTPCFRHVQQGDETLILSVEPDGTPEPDAPQSVDRIVAVPLSCGPAVTS